MTQYAIKEGSSFKFDVITQGGDVIVKGLYFCQAVAVKAELEYLANIINIVGEDLSVMGEVYE